MCPLTEADLLMNDPSGNTSPAGIGNGSVSLPAIKAICALCNSNGWPTSNHIPFTVFAYIGHPLDNTSGNNCLEKSYFSPVGINSITSGSMMYKPALIKLENASSAVGFSLNREM